MENQLELFEWVEPRCQLYADRRNDRGELIVGPGRKRISLWRRLVDLVDRHIGKSRV